MASSSSRYTGQNVPAAPPLVFSNAVRDSIGLGQGDDSGGETTEGAHHLGGRVWEREGDSLNPEYHAMFEELNRLRGNAVEVGTRLAQVVDDIGGLPVGLKLRVDIRGLSIGELCEQVKNRYGIIWMRGLYLYAVVRDLHLMQVREEDLGEHFNTYLRDTRVSYVPLWRVLPVLPTTGEQYFVGGTLRQHLAGMKKLFGNRVEELASGGYFDSELSGSDVASFFILEEVSLVRRNSAPAYMDNRISLIRTGGFGEILPEKTRFRFSLGELEEEYNRTYCEVYPTHSAAVRERKGKLLHDVLMESVFMHGMLYPEFHLVVPGGVGCCVDNCVDELMKIAAEEYDGLPLLLPFENYATSNEARVETKKKYVEERLLKNKKRMREGESAQRAIQYGRDFDNSTRHGYTPHFFGLFRDSCIQKLGVEPRLFYERFEEFVDDRIGRPNEEIGVDENGELTYVIPERTSAAPLRARRKLLEVGRKPADIRHSDMAYSPFHSSEEGGVMKLCLFRISLNGLVYRHYPMSYYVFNKKVSETASSTPFISEKEEMDKTSGLLHAIGVFPYIRVSILGDKVLLHSLFSVIEKRTIELMKVSKGRSIGGSHVVASEVQSLVEYQNKRYATKGEVNTLIYGGHQVGDIDEVAPEDDYEENSTIGRSERNKFVSRPLIIAYDIETVELTEECCAFVPTRFLTFNPDNTKYGQLKKQIPYMVQWVPVNLSDEGSLLEKKEAKNILPRRDEPDEVWAATDALYSMDGGGWLVGGLKKYKKPWIVLDEARLEYGDEQLGQCVEDFIANATDWAIAHGYTSVQCYAHNGAAFDAHIVQAFNTRFTVSKILDVRGSLLSMSLSVPTPGHKLTKHITFSFGDTKKFLAGSLAALCRDFKVPEIWSKIDFPITRIDWRNCYNSEVKSLVAPYAMNDVYSLAFIVKQINRMLCMHPKEVIVPGMEEWASGCPSFIAPSGGFEEHVKAMTLYPLSSMKPPIHHFCTIMGFVKRVLKCHIDLSLANRRIPVGPKAVDVPAIRHWIDMSLIGGRVSAYCKVYASSRLNAVLDAWMSGRLEESKELIAEAVRQQDTMKVLDMTSLYPSAMTFCPLPMGELYSLGREEAISHINLIGCGACESRMALCSRHCLGEPAAEMRPFSIILVRDMKPSNSAKAALINLVGRKIKPMTYRANGGAPVASDHYKKSDGVSYSLETEAEATYRLWGEGEGEEWGVYGSVQAFSNIDLYWAGVCGFVFEVVGGFSWGMSGILSDLYTGLFALRARAKTEQNFSLQLGLKNLLNGGYGVHCQKLISSVDKVVNPGEDLYRCDVKDAAFNQYLRDNHYKPFDSRFIIKESIPLATQQTFVKAKMPSDLGEVMGGLSPNHIGAAVLAWSRHLMNLVMVPIFKKEGDGAITYTDTDSMSTHQKTYDWLVEKMPHIIDESGKTMGTFKNDHSEIFKNGVVLFSALGGKKVKMHIVACPDTGKLKVCNTFKGFICEGTDEEGRRFSEDKAGFTISSALLDILYDGKPSPHTGTRWTRGLKDGGGVRIEKGVQFSSETSEAYLGHCMAYTLLSPPNPGFWEHRDSAALLIGCVPHGSTFTSNSTRFDMGDPKIGLSDEWRSWLESRGLIRSKLAGFLEQYYPNRDGHYKPSEEEDVWNEMNEVLDKVNDQIENNNGQEEDDSSDFNMDPFHSSPTLSPFSTEYDFGLISNDEDSWTWDSEQEFL